ncbi:ABC transporter substrate-binding protein [Salinibius halmophilus]|uniref:ABC transporter substrate-binding protein n=1 Tax=Salinibius halmophilus TaxID=1853216 RepID=UPI000E6653FE|nr:ABC transporter substrate-binding protein [Salinibius halmophilus]
MKNILSSVGLLASLSTPALALDCDDGFRPFTHAAGETCIPVDPKRIVTLQDQNALLPLMELGVKPIASAGHINAAGEQMYRRMQGYDTAGIAFIGTYGEPDIELVAAQNPDLIFASPWPADAYERYSKIAPTVVIDMFSNDLEVALMQFADAVNRTDRARELQTGLSNKVAELQAALGPALAQTTISAIAPEWQGSGFDILSETQAWGAIKRLLNPTMSEQERSVAQGEFTRSIESLIEHEADVMFLLTFDADQSANSASFNEFIARPLVQALPVQQAGQLYNLRGGEMVGSAWGKIENGLDQISAILLQDGLNRNLVIE